jgi:ribosomal protein S3
VADGVFYAELNQFLTRELGEEGYAGVEVRVVVGCVCVCVCVRERER